jgi:hypothetical protein
MGPVLVKKTAKSGPNREGEDWPVRHLKPGP